MRCLIDGDIIAYTSAVRAGDRIELPVLCEQIANMTEKWANSAADEDSDIIVCLSKGKSFRYALYPEYKANRRNKPKPPYLKDAYQILRDEFYTAEVHGLEGDDILGIYGTDPKTESIMITIDKDLLQVPGLHHNPNKDDFRHIRRITPDEGEWFFFLQWLMGDPGDGIPGIPGIGPKKAMKIIQGAEQIWEELQCDYNDIIRDTICDVYREAGLSDEYRVQMEQCVRIKTFRDIPI